MQTLPSSEFGFKYWLKVIVVIATFISPLIYFATLFNYSHTIRYFISDPTINQGTPVDTCINYRCSGEVGQLADDGFGYDMARDVSRIVTTITLSITTFLAFKLVFRSGSSKMTAKDILRGLALQYSYPIAVHLIGTFAINNYGGIGGAL